MSFLCLLLGFLIRHILAVQIPLIDSCYQVNPSSVSPSLSSVSLPQEWETIGPFPIGSRETGIDPLSAFGGFENLPYSEVTKYPSELADGGFVGWKRIASNADGSVGPISYPEIRWDFNQKPCGWASLQHSTYLRGQFKIATAGQYVVSFNQVLSYKIDNDSYVGNVYNDRFPAPSIVYLKEGVHQLYVQMVLDVRISGAGVPPKLSFSGSIVPLTEVAPQNEILVFPETDVIPEIINDDFVSPDASITIMNARNLTDSQKIDINKRHLFYSFMYKTGWLRLINVLVFNQDNVKLITTDPASYTIKIAPGQVFSIPVKLSKPKDIPVKLDSIYFQIELEDASMNEKVVLKTQSYTLKRRSWGDVYKMTFVDYDKTVQYAMLRPPKNMSCVRSKSVGCPVVVALHGAGVEVTSEFWLNAYRQQNYAWILYPSGRTPWGHDWHGTSNLNVQNALNSMMALPGVPKQYQEGLRPDIQKLIYSGHSNGGQGAWWMTSHYPDQVLAAIPASGFVNMYFYVPYFMRIGYAYSDPILRAILEVSISEHDIPMYASNLAGLPILARTGALDDNVPPLHTRRLVRLVSEWNRNPSAIELSEVPGKGHWFDDVLSDDTVQRFLDRFLDKVMNPNLTMPPFQDAFTISTINPFTTGPKGGIRILQLEVPFRLATIRVHRFGSKWVLDTTNVRRLGFVSDDRHEGIKSFSIDGTKFDVPPSLAGPSYLRKSVDSAWEAAPDLLWISKERHPSTYGPAIHILNHPFVIVIPSHTYENITVYHKIAQQLATSWHSCCRGNTQIVKDVDVLDGLAAQYNLIGLGGPVDNLYTRRREKEGVSTMLRYLPSGGVQIEAHKYEQPGTGVIFLAPSPTRTRTALYISGIDIPGLNRAAWSAPFRTGLTIPDYFVIGEEYGDPSTGWTADDGAPYGGAGTKGPGGILAAGYWNNTWDFDPRCGYLK